MITTKKTCFSSAQIRAVQIPPMRNTSSGRSGTYRRPKEGVAGTDSYIHRLNEDERKMLERVFHETVRDSDLRRQ